MSGALKKGEKAKHVYDSYKWELKHNVDLHQYRDEEAAILQQLHMPGKNYVGPKTRIIENIEKGVKPVDALDQGAFEHDIEYLAGFNNPALIRKSDEKLLKKAGEIAADPKSSEQLKKEAGQVIFFIGLKIKMEDLGVLDKTTFSNIPELTKKERNDRLKFIEDYEKGLVDEAGLEDTNPISEKILTQINGVEDALGYIPREGSEAWLNKYDPAYQETSEEKRAAFMAKRNRNTDTTGRKVWEEIRDDVIEVWGDFHKHPNLGAMEGRLQDVLEKRLGKLGEGAVDFIKEKGGDIIKDIVAGGDKTLEKIGFGKNDDDGVYYIAGGGTRDGAIKWMRDTLEKQYGITLPPNAGLNDGTDTRDESLKSMFARMKETAERLYDDSRQRKPMNPGATPTKIGIMPTKPVKEKGIDYGLDAPPDESGVSIGRGATANNKATKPVETPVEGGIDKTKMPYYDAELADWLKKRNENISKYRYKYTIDKERNIWDGAPSDEEIIAAYPDVFKPFKPTIIEPPVSGVSIGRGAPINKPTPFWDGDGAVASPSKPSAPPSAPPPAPETPPANPVPIRPKPSGEGGGGGAAAPATLDPHAWISHMPTKFVAGMPSEARENVAYMTYLRGNYAPKRRWIRKHPYRGESLN